MSNKDFNIACFGPSAISLAYEYPILWALPGGALIVIVIDAFSLHAKTYTIKTVGAIHWLIGVLNIFALGAFVYSISFMPTYQGSAFVYPELFFPFYLIVVASLVLIWFGLNEGTKEEIRWGNIHDLPLQPLLLIPHSPILKPAEPD